MSSPVLDDLDRQLIDLLASDARVSNRKIATRLGVTEGTVRGRIKRLQQEKLISFTAITGLQMARKSQLAFIYVQAEVERTREVARQLAEMEPINAVLVTMGRFNILAMTLFEELDELVEVASDRILAIPGVHHVETSIAVKTMKYNARVAKITEANPVDGNGEDDD
jgi:Lrp/AsnC family transcriptional regulator for asnA, asnC and gidA